MLYNPEQVLEKRRLLELQEEIGYERKSLSRADNYQKH